MGGGMEAVWRVGGWRIEGLVSGGAPSNESAASALELTDSACEAAMGNTAPTQESQGVCIEGRG